MTLERALKGLSNLTTTQKVLDYDLSVTSNLVELFA
jgi:hypothetical protein